MSFIDRTKEFFGLAPADLDAEDPYYDEPRYESNGGAAYCPRSAADYDRPAARPASDYDRPASRVAPRDDFAPTIVPISVTTFNEAQKVGDPFRDGDVVVFELTDADFKVAKRIIDFAAGLCFGLRGSMVNLTKKMDTSRRVFAIVPEDTDVSNFELERSAGLR